MAACGAAAFVSGGARGIRLSGKNDAAAMNALGLVLLLHCPCFLVGYYVVALCAAFWIVWMDVLQQFLRHVRGGAAAVLLLFACTKPAPHH